MSLDQLPWDAFKLPCFKHLVSAVECLAQRFLWDLVLESQFNILTALHANLTIDDRPAFVFERVNRCSPVLGWGRLYK